MSSNRQPRLREVVRKCFATMSSAAPLVCSAVTSANNSRYLRFDPTADYELYCASDAYLRTRGVCGTLRHRMQLLNFVLVLCRAILAHSVSEEYSCWSFGEPKATFRPLTFVDQSDGLTQSSDADLRERSERSGNKISLRGINQ